MKVLSETIKWREKQVNYKTVFMLLNWLKNMNNGIFYQIWEPNMQKILI